MPELTDRAAARLSDGPVLRVRGLVKSYGPLRVVDDVSFDIEAGEVLTLLGPSGCGKSTTLRMIAGLDQPDAGEVWVRGRLVASPAKKIMVPPEGRKVGLVFQSYAIWPHMTVADNIGYPLKVRGLDREAIAAKVTEIIALVKLSGLGARMSTELSGGQQQRVALARALVYEPDLLLLDEPLSNLDSVLRKEMRSQIKLLQSRLGTTVLYVTHDQEEAMALSSRIVVMNYGRIEQSGRPDVIYDQPSTRFVRDFVGQTIRLHGSISSDARPMRIRIGACTIEASDGDHGSLRLGREVEVSIRPEDVRLQENPTAGDNCLSGHVIEATYLGDRVECVIRIDGVDEPVVVNADRRRKISPKDRVVLAVDRACVRIWPL
jgi:ABC-type Fe3+/spermidine/putrescine transport system ATPase subunit